LLNEVVNQIQINFNYYHAHIYLLDEKQENLVMEAGTGSAGTEMKAKGHRISLQAVTSLVVRAARTSQIVTIDNVRESPDWLPNPLLPDTRAEMAVPIILDQKVVGVLDVQENRIAGLDDGDASLLRSLANQVAVAIRNARLFAEVETALAEVKEAQKRYVTEAWQKSKVSGIRHLYASPDVSISDNEQQQLMVDARKQTMTQGHPVIVDSEDDTDEKFLVAPISLRDQTIGVLKIKTAGSDHQSWDEDDLAMIDAVIDQIAQTAENLRLYDDTRRHAGREQTIRQISEKMRTTTNLEDLIQTAARELSEHFAADYAVVELGIKKDQV
jgi:GAF domain-containing protein